MYGVLTVLLPFIGGYFSLDTYIPQVILGRIIFLYGVILMVVFLQKYLLAVDSADFTFLLNQTGLSRGNLSTHLSALEGAGYISVKKEFVEKIPRTLMKITPEGRRAVVKYKTQMLTILNELLRA